MPGAYFLETGALFKRYQPERGSELVDELYDGKLPDEVFLTSQFTLVETKAAPWNSAPRACSASTAALPFVTPDRKAPATMSSPCSKGACPSDEF